MGDWVWSVTLQLSGSLLSRPVFPFTSFHVNFRLSNLKMQPNTDCCSLECVIKYTVLHMMVTDMTSSHENRPQLKLKADSLHPEGL